MVNTQNKSRFNSSLGVVIERKEYQDMLMKGALAFSHGAQNDSVFGDEFFQQDNARKRFSNMILGSSSSTELQNHLLYLFQASAIIEEKYSSVLSGVAAGYIATLWKSTTDKELKNKLASGLSELIKNEIISVDEYANPADFLGNGATAKEIHNLLASVSH